MQICRTIEEFRNWRAAASGRLAFVPTMGALHQGHRSLMRAGRAAAQRLAVSIFVNPAQFGPAEDFARYPRDFAADEQLCREAGVDCIFYPAPGTIYPPGFCSWVEVAGLSETLEGAARPGHFRGVATVVLKLFNIVQPDVALFGWKDAQQLIVLRRMAADLNLTVELLGCETVREPDGLACSSRNVYLTPQQRAEAPVLLRALKLAGTLAAGAPAIPAPELLVRTRALIETESSGQLDYLVLVSQHDLLPLERIEPGSTLIALAVRFGAVRLLDNLRL